MSTPRGDTGRIYLDHAATTPVRPEVFEAMLPFFGGEFGNPSSLHAEGRRAAGALEDARRRILASLRAGGFDLLFTSGGTESDQLAVVGTALARLDRRPTSAKAGTRVLASAVEHLAVLEAEHLLKRLGVALVRLPVGSDGVVELEQAAAALTDGALLLSVMAANNETGALQPVAELGERATRAGVPFHTDAVQLLGKRSLVLDELSVDIVTLSAHKIYGPKGIAALLLRRETPFAPLVRGGSQERGLRAGTPNVAAAVGFARAVELAVAEQATEAPRLAALRDRLRAEVLRSVSGVVGNTPALALPNILSLSISDVQGESLVKLLDELGVAVSTGSACSAGASRASHVLAAMGRSEREIRGSVRFSMGASTTAAAVSAAHSRLEEAVDRLRSLAPRS